jgi:DNA-binding LytR/AlgR family response regulator
MMRALRVAICDDEPLALDRLSGLLARCGDVINIGAAMSGQALLDIVAATKTDVVLLDIEMPHMDGFDVVAALAGHGWDTESPPPLVIFSTARSEFALDAFDSGALDFISKPVRLARLQQALDRARASIMQIEALWRLRELSSQLDQLKAAHAGGGDERQIWVRKGAEAVRLDVRDLDWVGAEGEYVRFHVGGDSYLERNSLQNVAAALELFGFVRIHRSAIVNADKVAAVEKGVWGRSVLRLRSGAKLPVGKKYRHAVRAVVKGGCGKGAPH